MENGGSALHCALLVFSSVQDSLASAMQFTILLHCTVSFCIVSYYAAHVGLRGKMEKGGVGG